MYEADEEEDDYVKESESSNGSEEKRSKNIFTVIDPEFYFIAHRYR